MSFSLFASFGFWRLPASAADLKFLHCPLRVRNGNFKSKGGTGGISNKISNAKVT
jgi:hypothetical protein